MGLKNTRSYKTFASIISDGSIRVKTDESNPLAVKRDWELADGTKGTKYELVYTELSGVIQDIEFRDGDYGTSLNIAFQDNEGEPIILTMNIESTYAEDLMKKLPAIDYLREVTVKPYSFEDDNKRLKRGISVSQGEIKVKNFFYDADKKTNLHDYPAIPKDHGWDKNDWKIYFLTTRKFLKKFTEEVVIPAIPKLSTEELF